MSFSILYNGTQVWIRGSRDVIDPVAELELNTAGRCSFTLTPDHPMFYGIEPMKGTIEVWDGNTMVWFGRPVTLERNIKNEKPVYCEGALAYFNDSAQRPRSSDSMTASALLSAIVTAHNAQVPADRQFTVGTVSVPATVFSWENDYEESLHTIETMLERCGGYLLPRRSGSTNYLDYLYDLPLNSGQAVAYGVNMLSFSRTYSFSEILTAVLPIGGVPEGETDPVTIASVNSGDDILDGPGVATYGRIIKVLKFPTITTAAALKSVAQAYLDGVEFQPINIQAEAADLSLLDANYSPYRIGYKYHVYSVPHDVDAWVPLLRVSIQMDTAVRRIALGSGSGGGLIEHFRYEERQQDYVKQSVYPAVGGRSWDSPMRLRVNARTFTVAFMNGNTVLQTVNDVTAGADATYTGETPTRGSYNFLGWDPAPTNIQADTICYAQFDDVPDEIIITTLPTTLAYEDGDTLDFAGIVVKAKRGGAWYTDSNYPDSVVPFEELVFPDTVAVYSGPLEVRSDLNTVLRQPIICTSGWISYVTVKAGQYTSRGAMRPVGPGRVTAWHRDSRTILYILASAEPTAGFYKFQRSTRVEGYSGYVPDDFDDTGTLPREYTYQGKTVYWTHGSLAYTWYNWPEGSYVEASLNAQDSGNPDYEDCCEIAWTLIYGEVTGGTQEIPVQWPLPRAKFPGVSKTLATSYEIEVSPASNSGSGGTTVDDEGFSGNEGNF